VSRGSFDLTGDDQNRTLSTIAHSARPAAKTRAARPYRHSMPGRQPVATIGLGQTRMWVNTHPHVRLRRGRVPGAQSGSMRYRPPACDST
jgi:hypothetical protein